MDKLNGYLGDIGNKIPKQGLSKNSVSKGSVGWHIEHILLTIEVVIEALKRPKHGNYKWKFSLVKMLVFATKTIPRGKAQSPAAVVPKGNMDNQSLKAHLDLTIEKIKELDNQNTHCYFNHPFFGDLKLKQAIAFLEIHTHHHIKIMNDILKG